MASSLPEFEWEIKLKSGNYVASLIVPPYVFRRKIGKKIGLVSSFCCTTCEKKNVTNNAKAVLISIDEDGRPTYDLQFVPETHACSPPSMNIKSRQFYPICHRIMTDNKTMSIGKVYKLAKKEILSGLTPLQTKQVIRGIPTMEQCNGNLYKFRGSFYPPALKTAVSLMLQKIN